MRDLLESVSTAKLQSSYEKYLPAVLNNSSVKPLVEKQVLLTESRKEVTGDKSAKTTISESNNNVVELKRLAGLK